MVLHMNLNCGIVGLPNVGKSTLFNALVGSELAQAANFPFCTIGKFVYCYSNVGVDLCVEPNVGLVNVPDDRLVKLAEISKSAKTIPAVVRQ